MRVIICGSRGIVDPIVVEEAVRESEFEVTQVISGGATGPDSLGAQWALQNGIPVVTVLPDWKTHGKAAGPIRNSKMLEQADAVIAIWDGKSRGTMDTIHKADLKQLPIYVKRYKEEEVIKKCEDLFS